MPVKIAIAGKKTDTENYVRYVSAAGLEPMVALRPADVAQCDALLLPGGGDITPAFFGEKNHGSRNIDTELDILQLQALELYIRGGKPVLGICKGMQIINVGLGGAIIQDMDTADLHRYRDGDQYHATAIEPSSWLYDLYGDSLTVNSAHHQSVGRLGQGLRVVQRCTADECPEALVHESLPILGVQWHPERLPASGATPSGGNVLSYLVSLVPSSRR